MAAAAYTFVAQGSSPALPSLQAQDFSAAPGTRETLDRYCVTCHNERLKTGGLALDRMDLARVADGARRLGKGRPQAPNRRHAARRRAPARPGRGRRAGLLAGDRRSIARRRRNPNPGPSLLRRLNRAEYANAIRDLLAAGRGRRIAAAARQLRLRLRQHRRRAGRLAGAAGALSGRGGKNQRAGGWRSRRRPGAATPTGSVRICRRTGISRACRSARSAGCWSATCFRSTASTPSRSSCIGPTSATCAASSIRTTSKSPSTDERVHAATIGGNDDLAAAFEKPTDTADAIDARVSLRLPVNAGPHEVAIAFVENFAVVGYGAAASVSEERRRHARLDRPAAHPVAHDQRTVQGHRPGRHAEPAPDFRLPAAPARTAESACARQILSTLARRAFRRPVTDADLQPLLAFYEAGRREGDVRNRHRAGAARHPRQPEVRLPPRTGSGGRRARRGPSRQRRRAGLASVVLPLEQPARR